MRTSSPDPAGGAWRPTACSCSRDALRPPRSPPAARRTRRRPQRSVAPGAAPRPRRLSRCGRVGCLAAAWVKAAEHAAVADDQPLTDLRLALAKLGKLGLCELRDGRHPLAEHLRQIVTRPRPRDVNHARQQRDLASAARPSASCRRQQPSLPRRNRRSSTPLRPPATPRYRRANQPIEDAPPAPETPTTTPFPAGCFKRLNGVFTAGPTTSSRFSRPTRSGSAIRLATRLKMPVFTSSRRTAITPFGLMWAVPR